jgi:oxygen-independent coproporphyrinogen-3 oxidase
VNPLDLGVYIHIPFCERVCPYCDFAVVAARPLETTAEDRYVEGVLSELAQRRGEFPAHSLATLYFGGGTPALLRPDSLARLIEAVLESFPSSEAASLEVTMELNPSTVERTRLPGFREAGVNRLSVGVQSFSDAQLKTLGRAHRAEEAHLTLEAARQAGFDNISVDLIFGVPGQTLSHWKKDLEEALNHSPEHISTYGLTIEEGTPYASSVERGILCLPAEEDVARMYEEVQRRLEEAGVPLYELSNFARPGFESKHNRRYWRGQPVLGLGVGAFSNWVSEEGAPFGGRRANSRDLSEYLRAVEAGSSAETAPMECLTEAQARLESIFLGLRTREGMDVGAFEARFGKPPQELHAEAISTLLREGLLETEKSAHLRLTPKGRLLSDTVFAAFVE